MRPRVQSQEDPRRTWRQRRVRGWRGPVDGARRVLLAGRRFRARSMTKVRRRPRSQLIRVTRSAATIRPVHPVLRARRHRRARARSRSRPIAAGGSGDRGSRSRQRRRRVPGVEPVRRFVPGARGRRRRSAPAIPSPWRRWKSLHRRQSPARTPTSSPTGPTSWRMRPSRSPTITSAPFARRADQAPWPRSTSAGADAAAKEAIVAAWETALAERDPAEPEIDGRPARRHPSDRRCRGIRVRRRGRADPIRSEPRDRRRRSAHRAVPRRQLSRSGDARRRRRLTVSASGRWS